MIINSREEVIPYGKELVKKGAQNVIVSFAEKGAVLINKDIVLYANALKGKLKAQLVQVIQWLQDLLATYAKTNSIEEAFRFSVAAGSATAFSLGLCTSEKMEVCYLK